MAFYSAAVGLLPAQGMPLVGLTGGFSPPSAASKGSHRGRGVVPAVERLPRDAAQAAYPCKPPFFSYYCSP